MSPQERDERDVVARLARQRAALDPVLQLPVRHPQRSIGRGGGHCGRSESDQRGDDNQATFQFHSDPAPYVLTGPEGATLSPCRHSGCLPECFYAGALSRDGHSFPAR
jgi:hypothetical protein